jgi:hypothetical protein
MEVDKAVEKFLDAINDLADAGGTWKEKRDAVIRQCTHNDRTNLEEIITWFAEEEQEG